jgi:hypothetical protein
MTVPGETTGITVVCHRCRLLVDVPGTPDTPEKILATADGIGWLVIGNKCYCLNCSTPKETAP